MLAVREVQLAYDNVTVVDCLELSPDGSAAWEAALKRCVYSSLSQCIEYLCPVFSGMRRGLTVSRHVSQLD